MTAQQALPKAANFGDLALNQGTNMEIDLQVANIGSIERVGKNNTPCQKCILADQGGNQEKVTIWMGRTGTALAEINREKWLTFNLSASKYKGQNQYGGFWQMEAPVISQAPPKAPQATNPVARTIVQDKPDWDAIAEGKVRHGVVCAFIQAGKHDVELSVIEYWVRYIIDVKLPSEDRICPDCGGDKTKCDCRPF